MLIDGSLVPEGRGGEIASIDPATGQVITTIPEADHLQVDEAVRAAATAMLGRWGSARAEERARVLFDIADRLDADAHSFALLDTLDNGKPLTTATEDIAAAIETFRYMAGWATKINGRTMSMGENGAFHAYTLRQPSGVVGQIIPWNFPIVSIAWKLAPALAAGCAVVLKPAELTSLSALRFAALVAGLDIPPGVINIVTGTGPGVGAALVEHPLVDRVSFTGSGVTGRWVAQTAAATMKRVTLELGGKSPVVVFPDADLDHAIESAANAIFFNQGEVCTAGSRLLVHRDVFDAVIDGVAERAKRLSVGDGFDPETEVGPLISEAHLGRVSHAVEAAIRDGAELLCGGPVKRDSGFFYGPTVLVENRRDAKVSREEIFGPVLVAQSFDGDDLQAVIDDVNDTLYGLGASIFTRDITRAHRFAIGAKSGTVWVNTHLDHGQDVPFGGYKQSGYGRELGEEAVLSYTELKSVKVRL
ncbi:aldehyde dehydrogenase family protein [Acrocarpospora catenulata]|uniref:aldehyde dehydrogenase family protein n=1 Tax=Acrocarpospora catenulata TaxID=2836182 RepID=UPI001BDA4613|nr:aldehyde dehydrogenase family protein [Acrocarpospora catenulata]